MVKEIRGRGLIWAIELDRPAAEEAVNLCMRDGLLANNVKPTAIRIIPPLTVSEAELDAAIDIIDGVLSKLESTPTK
jgi:acetylornithine/succinyldiaminopimelate/putrescine aminotransferase